MFLLSDRTRKSEHVLLGFVIGLAIAAAAYQLPIAAGAECITEVTGTRLEKVPGKMTPGFPIRVAHVFYQMRFEGRIERASLFQKGVCKVEFPGVSCTERDHMIDCRQQIKITGGLNAW